MVVHRALVWVGWPGVRGTGSNSLVYKAAGEPRSWGDGVVLQTAPSSGPCLCGRGASGSSSLGLPAHQDDSQRKAFGRGHGHGHGELRW